MESQLSIHALPLKYLRWSETTLSAISLGGFNESGLITFNLEDASNNVVFTDTKSANGNSAVTSDSDTPAEDGSYHWVVSFAGDSNNNPVSDFTSSSEQVVITEVTPTLTTSAAC